MTFNVKALALKRSQETHHDKAEWTKALESAQTSLKLTQIDPASLEHVANSSRSPAKFTVVARLMYLYGKAHPHGAPVSKVLLNYVNVSPFDLSDWVDSISYFYEWLTKNNRKIDFVPMLKYLECCSAAPDAKEQGQTLMGLLENMLDVHDYEAG